MNIRDYLASSVGKKQLISLTGLGLIVGFLIPHLIGNLLLLKGPQTFNSYSEHLHSLGIALRGIELIFFLLFLFHIVLTIRLVIENKIARGLPYKKSILAEKKSFAARTMPYTGAFILFFLIVHLFDFTFTTHTPPASMVNGLDLGLYGVVVNAFANPIRLIGYAFIMIIIGIHLSHAIQSVFQTFGLKNQRISFYVNIFSYALGVSLSLGFIAVLVHICLLN